MTEQDVALLTGMVQATPSVDRVVFTDENGKLDPIALGGMNIVGLFISPSGFLWLVDDTHVSHDMNKRIQPWCYSDKHLAVTFGGDIKNELLKKLEKILNG